MGCRLPGVSTLAGFDRAVFPNGCTGVRSGIFLVPKSCHRGDHRAGESPGLSPSVDPEIGSTPMVGTATLTRRQGVSSPERRRDRTVLG